MAVKIRLKRVGAKSAPYFRLVVTDARAQRDGRVIEEIGTYKPQQAADTLTVRADRLDYWLSQGAQPTESARSLLKKHGQWPSKR